MEEKKLDKDINVRSKTELSDEEIVKDIERSTGMPSYWKKIVLDLIHRLQAEIERLTSLYDGKTGFMTSSIGDLPLTVEGLRKAVDEISRLLAVQTELQELNAKYYNEAKDLRREKAELQKQVDELNKKLIARESVFHNLVIVEKDKSVKDTAKEILQEVFNLIKNANDKLPKIFPESSEYRKGYENSVRHFGDSILKIAKEKGVEVE